MYAQHALSNGADGRVGPARSLRGKEAGPQGYCLEFR